MILLSKVNIRQLILHDLVFLNILFGKDFAFKKTSPFYSVSLPFPGLSFLSHFFYLFRLKKVVFCNEKHFALNWKNCFEEGCFFVMSSMHYCPFPKKPAQFSFNLKSSYRGNICLDK